MPKDDLFDVRWASVPLQKLLDEYVRILISLDGWTCENGHLDPETGQEFVNDGRRDTCEICTRPRPKQA